MNKDELRRPDGQAVSQGMDRGTKILLGAEYVVSNPILVVPTIGLGYLGYKKTGIVGALVGAFLGFLVGFGSASTLARNQRREQDKQFQESL